MTSSNTLVPSLRTKFKTSELKELPGWRGLVSSSQSKLTIESNVPLLVKSRSDYNRNILYPHWDLSSPMNSQIKSPGSNKASGSFYAVQPREESLNYEKQPQYEKLMGKNILTGSITARAQPRPTEAVVPVFKSTSQLGMRSNSKVMKVGDKTPGFVAVKNLNIGVKVKELPEKSPKTRIDQGMQASQVEGGILNDFFNESVSRIGVGYEAKKDLYDAYLNAFRIGEITNIESAERFIKEKTQMGTGIEEDNLKSALKNAGKMMEEEFEGERNEESNCLQLSFLTNADRSGFFGSVESRGNINSYVEKGKSEIGKGSLGWRLDEDTHEGYSHQSTMITRSVLTRQKVEEVKRLPLKSEKIKIKHPAPSTITRQKEPEVVEAEKPTKKEVIYKKIKPNIKQHQFKAEETDSDLERSKSLASGYERVKTKFSKGKETLQPTPINSILVSPKTKTPFKKVPQNIKPSETQKKLSRFPGKQKKKKKPGFHLDPIPIKEKEIESQLTPSEFPSSSVIIKSSTVREDDFYSNTIPDYEKSIRPRKHSIRAASTEEIEEFNIKKTVKVHSNFSPLDPSSLLSDQQPLTNKTPQKLLIIPERNVFKHNTNAKIPKRKEKILKTQQSMPVHLEIDLGKPQKEGKPFLSSPVKSNKNTVERAKIDNSQQLMGAKQPFTKPSNSVTNDKPETKITLQPTRKSIVKSETTVLPVPPIEKISAHRTMKFLGVNEDAKRSSKRKSNSSRSSFSNSGFEVSEESEDELPIDPEKIKEYRKKSLVFEIKALERLKTIEISEKTPKVSSRILSKRSSVLEKDLTEKVEPLDHSDSIEEADIYTELGAFTYNKGSNRNLFTPQVIARFTQRKDLNNIGNINEIEINENYIDYNAIDNYMLKNRFLNSKSATTFAKNESNSKIEQLDLNSMLPIEIHKKKLKEFEKIRKRENFLKTRGEIVQIGGKARTTFSNLQQPLPAFSAQTSPSSKIVRSGGSNSVRDQVHSSERHYCRLKDQFDLNSLSAPPPFSAEALLRSLDSNFLHFEKVYNK